MKCYLNCGRDADFHDEISGIAICEKCWKVIDAVAVHCIVDYLNDALSENGIKIKSPFRFKPLQKK